MSKITSSSADYQTFPTLFELEPVAGKKVTVDFTAPELSSLGGLTLKLRKKWKHTQIIVRGDSHFCSHDFMDWATDRQDGIHFITGLAGNVKLQKITAHWLDTAVASHKATWRTLSTGEWQYLFNYGNYKNDIRKGKCACGVTVCGREVCVVLLPDDWQWNEDAVGICGFSIRLVTECP